MVNVSDSKARPGVRSIVRAKVTPPQIRSDLIDRARLIEIFDVGLSHSLTLVIAPAGYGKSTIVAQWLASLDRPTAWLTLDPLDDDLATFVTTLVSAISRAYPDAESRTADLLTGSQSVPPTVLADTLLEDLADLPGSLAIAVDDYHQITDRSVSVFMERLIQYLPTNTHLVVVTRVDPTIPLARMRARSELTEVRATDLQFSVEETQKLLTELTHSLVDAESATLLDRQAEGWVLGLRLAALAKNEDETIEALAQRFVREGAGYTTDYLIDEVLSKQPAEIQDFLLRTSILERMTEPLCSAILGRSGYETDLGSVSRSNLLITPLDDQHLWYRYHPLFREFLRQRLTTAIAADDVRSMHRRAADWLAVEGLIGEAISHLVAADDSDTAVGLIEENLHAALNREEWWRVERWLDLIPEPLQRRPEMLIARAWSLIVQNRLADLWSLAAEAEAQLDQPGVPQALRAKWQPQINTFRAQRAYMAGDDAAALESSAQAVAGLRTEMAYARSNAHVYNGVARVTTLGATDALGYLQSAIDSKSGRSDVLLGRLLLGQCLLYLMSGDLKSLRERLELLGAVGARSRLAATTSWANYGLGLVAYEWNDLTQAEMVLQQVVEAVYRANGRAAYEAHVALAMTLEAMGRRGEADDILRRAREYLIESDNLAPLSLITAAELRLEVIRGNVTALAASPVASPDQLSKELRTCLLVSPTLSRVHALIYIGTAESLAEADRCLTAIRDVAERQREQRRMIEILGLRAMLSEGLGQPMAALDFLRQSLRLAEPSRFVRVFVQYGPVMERLLERLQEADPPSYYVSQLLGAFSTSSALVPSTLSVPDDRMLRLRASLTNRQMDVLILLAQRLSNKEIAGQLFVSPMTVKKYTNAIYRKLGVNNRRAAVSLAEHVGLIPRA